jgi:hypothetical protein
MSSLSDLQNQLIENTETQAIKAISVPPSLSESEIEEFVKAANEMLIRVVKNGESVAKMKFAKRTRYIENEWGTTCNDWDDNDIHACYISPSFRKWWFDCKKAVPADNTYPLPTSTHKIAQKRRDDLFLTYLADLAAIWRKRSDVPVHVLDKVTQKYHPGNYHRASYSRATQKRGLCFDLTPEHQSPEVIAAREHLAKCEREWSEAHKMLNSAIESVTTESTKRRKIENE